MKWFLLSCVFLAGSAAAAADMDSAQRAYERGEWRVAADTALRNADAEGYAFAAGALLAQLMVEPDYPDREGLADEAFDLAEQAHDLDEALVEARLRLAGTLGFRGRYMSGFRAYAMRVPQRGRSLIESIVAEEPGNAWAVGMLGAWHLEVARRGGSQGLRALDASVEDGITAYNRAIGLDPSNPAPRYFYALALLALDEPAFSPVAEEQLAIAIALEPRDAFEAGIQAEAQLLHALMADPRAARDWADSRLSD